MSEAVFQPRIFPSLVPETRVRTHKDPTMRNQKQSITGIAPQVAVSSQSKQLQQNVRSAVSTQSIVQRNSIQTNVLQNPMSQSLHSKPASQTMSKRTIAKAVGSLLEEAAIQKEEKTVVQKIKHAKAVVMSERFQKHRTIVSIVLIACTFLAGIAIFVMTIRTNQQAVAQVETVSQQVSTAPMVTTEASAAEAPPDETPVTPAAVRSYTVPQDEPRYIKIDKIKVNARVLSAGILGNGELATPRNTNDTGWYNASSKPGEGGAMIIDGHVSGLKTGGIFYNLKNLNPDDRISVERGDGKVFNYRVVKKEQLKADKVDMTNMLLSVTPGKAGLNLITCGGKYNSATQTYEERTIVYAEEV